MADTGKREKASQKGGKQTTGKAMGKKPPVSKDASTMASRKGKRGNRPERGDRAARQASIGPSRARQTPSSPARSLYIEGRRAVAEALRTGFPAKRALVAEGQDDAGTVELLRALAAAAIPVDFVPRPRLDELSSHGAHQGIALEVGDFPYRDIADVIAAAGTGPSLVVVLDHVTDEGNLGAIARSAEVVGASGLVIASKRAAGVGVGTFKASAGAVLHLPIAQVTNLARAIDQLKDAGYWVVGASEHAEDLYWDAPLDGRVALVMGAEGTGISRLMLEKCDVLAKLPQRGAIESLNVAQAATVFCYEWLRKTWGQLEG